MLITEIAKMNWHPGNKKWYESKGYIFTKLKDEFEIKVEDLPNGSNVKIEIKCDLCGKIIPREYYRYISQREKSLTKIDVCKECGHEKMKLNTIEKLNQNLLNKEDSGYWTLKENRLKELKLYIEKYENINTMKSNEDGRKLNSIIGHYKETPMCLAQELGYKLIDISNKKPDNYYTKETLKQKFISIIKELGHFPYAFELKQYSITREDILKFFNGTRNLKKEINYIKDFMIDNNGFYNSSIYEVITANFLIACGLGKKYKREQHPFLNSGGNYRSDFMFTTENGKEIHCEVWGYSENYSKGYKIAEEYNKVKKQKQYLYSQNDIKLISIECDTFLNKSYKETIDNLYSIFNPYLKLDIQEVTQENIIPMGLSSNEDLFCILKPFIKNNCLPTTAFLRDNGYGRYYDEILKRYSNYNDFAKEFGCELVFNINGYWTIEVIRNCFDHMIKKYDRFLDSSEINKIKKSDKTLAGFSSAVNDYGFKGLIGEQINYCNYCVKENRYIPSSVILWLYDIAKQNGKNNSKYITKEIQDNAIEILTILKAMNKLSEGYMDYSRPFYVEDKTLNLIYCIFIHMFKKYQEILSEKEYRHHKKMDNSLKEIEIYKRIQRENWSLRDVKIGFYNYCLENNIEIPLKEITKLTKISNIKKKESSATAKYDEEYQSEIVKILDKLNNITIKAS